MELQEGPRVGSVLAFPLSTVVSVPMAMQLGAFMDKLVIRAGLINHINARHEAPYHY